MRIRIFLQTGGLNSDLLLLLTLGFFNIAVALDQDLSAQPRIVAQTERGFSARCAEIGIRDSFLEYFAVDAIHFEPEPRLARPDLERESSSTGLRLTWEPKIIRVASSGQLAVSTGPYVLQDTSGKRSSGYFLSIWKKQSGGEWRVGADIGVPVTPPGDFPEDFQAIIGLPTSEPLERSRLMVFERQQFSRDVDIGTIYRSIVLPETVLERADLPLMNGEANYETFLSAQKTKRAKLLQSDGDVSGNLGLTYGTESEEGPRAAYLRVWVWLQSRRWLLFDVVAKME